MMECDEEQSFFQCRLPLLRLVCSILHFSPSVGIQFFALIGILLSALAIYTQSCRNIVTFLILYLLYQTIYEAGGVFMYYQWDALLLESTVLVAILAWFEDGPADSVALYGIVAFLARVSFMNGATKFLSKCPTWWNLTAFNYHFESQPLPTPLAWHAHHFPLVFKQFATLLTTYIEIILPPFFLIPLIHVRYLAFFCQVLLMTLTIFTGNYGVLNYNMIVLLISLLETPSIPFGAVFLSTSVFAKMAYDIVYRLPWTAEFENGTPVNFALTLTQEAFQKFLVYYIDLIITFMATIFSIVLGYSLINGMPYQNKFRKISHMFFVVTATIILLIYGTVPLLRMDEKLAARTTENPMVMSYYRFVNKWNVANSYGSYRQMTGLHGRPEIVIEGSHHIEGPWKEIPLRVKPGKLSESPVFQSPHQSRLDIQMYYAAEGTYQQNPFFLSLVHHLMQNTTEVVNLIGDYPFKNRSEPMNFVRAKLYMYHFTNIGDKNWWRRDFQEEYMPAFNKGNNALLQYLKEHNILTKHKSGFVNGPLGKYMKQWHRRNTGDNEFRLIFSVIILIFSKKLYNIIIQYMPNDD